MVMMMRTIASAIYMYIAAYTCMYLYTCIYCIYINKQEFYIFIGQLLSIKIITFFIDSQDKQKRGERFFLSKTYCDIKKLNQHQKKTTI